LSNNATPSLPYPDDAFFQGATVTGPGFQFALNPKQFATEATAQALAKQLGGIVITQNLAGPYLWSVPQYGIQIPPVTTIPPKPGVLWINAGLLADSVNKYGTGDSNPLWPK